MILPVGASSFKEAMKMGLEAVIKKKYGQDATNIGDEGGFATNIQESKEGLELLKTAVAKLGYAGKVIIGMDVAASEFYGSDKTYDLNFKEENNDGSQKISDQDDWEHFAKLTGEIGAQVQIVGDDLLVTDPKVNQIGSVTESIEAVKMSKKAVMAMERLKTLIADLSVGMGQIKTRALCRSERLAKYNPNLDQRLYVQEQASEHLLSPIRFDQFRG
ncbi:enolase 2 [Olea europaea subsp. europaea]|uniref:phosphopyruvate hydratase n=1 Tax=Olea europaea subsp. europaea TaxID=158383 RepID=A0A8S0Q5X0_OLEEU|nr:enolase 2 [Olea europaea subsp. europaea]